MREELLLYSFYRRNGNKSWASCPTKIAQPVVGSFRIQTRQFKFRRPCSFFLNYFLFWKTVNFQKNWKNSKMNIHDIFTRFIHGYHVATLALLHPLSKKLHTYTILAILYILYTHIHTHIFVENKQLRYFIPKACIFLEQAHSPI